MHTLPTHVLQQSLLALLLGTSLLIHTACGDDASDNGQSNPSTSQTTTSGGGFFPSGTSQTSTTEPEPNPGACQDGGPYVFNGFDGQITREYINTRQDFVHEVRNSSGDSYDVLEVRIDTAFPEDTIGTTDLSWFEECVEDDRGRCFLSVLLRTGCDDSGECARSFASVSGTLEVREIGSYEAPVDFSLHNITFREVIDTDDSEWGEYFQFTDSNDVGCLAEYDVQTTVPDFPTTHCASPIACVGEEAQDFSLPNCASQEPEPILDTGDDTRAVWIVFASGWCPNCPLWIPEVQRLSAAYQDQGLRVSYVFGENDSYEAPSFSECSAYATRYGINPSQFHIDNDGFAGFVNTLQHISWHPQEEYDWISIPWNAIVDTRTNEVVYIDRSGQPEELEEILEALFPPE